MTAGRPGGRDLFPRPRSGSHRRGQAAVIAELRAANASLVAANAALQARVAELERRLGKDSSNVWPMLWLIRLSPCQRLLG